MAFTKILIADDNPYIREGVRANLTDLHRIVLFDEAADGREAVDKTFRLHPDLILMDYNMPGMNGLEAIRAIRQRDTKTMIVVYSIWPDMRPVLLKAGANFFIDKNEDIDRIIQIIEHLADGQTTGN